MTRRGVGRGPFRVLEIVRDMAPDRWAVVDNHGFRVSPWIEYQHEAVEWAGWINAAWRTGYRAALKAQAKRGGKT